MEIEQATKPAEAGSIPPVTVGGDGSALTTDNIAAKGTTPLAEGVTPEASPAWMAQLAPDLKIDKSLTQFKTISELGKAHLDLQGKMANAVVLPGDKSTPEERATFYKKLGVPDNPKDYKLEKPKLPEGFTYEAKSEEEFLNVAHKLNLTQTQVKDLRTWYLGSMVKALGANLKAVKITTEECKTALRSELGEGFAAEMNHVQRGLDRFADTKGVVKGLFDKSGLGNHPEIIKMFARIGKMIGETSVPRGTVAAIDAGGVPGKRSDGQLAAVLYEKKGA